MTITLQSILVLLIGLIVLGADYWMVAYIVRALPIADPLGRIVLIATMVSFVILAIMMLLDFAGMGTGISVRAGITLQGDGPLLA